jgi:hypothetical protein
VMRPGTTIAARSGDIPDAGPGDDLRT